MMRTVQTPASSVAFSDNIQWYGFIYTVLAVTPDYEDDTVLFKVGFPRKLDGEGPVLNEITVRLAQQILVYKR